MASQPNGDFGDNNASNSPPRPSLTHTFSASTQAILDRLRGSGGLLASNTSGNVISADALPANFEDMKKSVMEKYRTTMSLAPAPPPLATPAPPSAGTLMRKKLVARKSSGSNADTPSRAASTSTAVISKVKGPARKGKGVKRKRTFKEDESDSPEDSLSSASAETGSEDDDGTVTLPTQTLSGRKVVKPTAFVPPPPPEEKPQSKKRGPATQHNKKSSRNIESALCKRCSRGNSPAKNQIVFCDQCNNGWHQYCHDPIISNDVVRDVASQWFCKACTEKKAARGKRGKKAGVEVKVERAPPVVTVEATVDVQNSTAAAKAQPRVWGDMSIDERRTALQRMPQSQLIDLFIATTNNNPSITIDPIFFAFRPPASSASVVAPITKTHYSSQLPPAHPTHNGFRYGNLKNGMNSGSKMTPHPGTQQGMQQAYMPYDQPTSSPVYPLPHQSDQSVGVQNQHHVAQQHAPEQYAQLQSQQHSTQYQQHLNQGGSQQQRLHQSHEPHQQPHSHGAESIFADTMDLDLEFPHELINDPSSLEPTSSLDPHVPLDSNMNGAEQAFDDFVAQKQHDQMHGGAEAGLNGNSGHGDQRMNLEHGTGHGHIADHEHEHQTHHDIYTNDGFERDDESRASTPASPPYPKPGMGLMARLRTDEEELDWLVGTEEEDAAFSHAVLGGMA